MDVNIRYAISRNCRRVLRHLPKSLKGAWLWVITTFRLVSGIPSPGILINESEVRPQYRRALRELQDNLGAENIGDYLEFGVYRGTSLLLMYDELIHANLNHVRLFGFDVFSGLPPDQEGEWREGIFKVEYDEVVQSLDDHGIDWSRVTLVKGLFQDTLNSALVAEQGLCKASLIMMDCVMYSSTKEALDFCGPLILDQAVIFFDDWGPLAKKNKGEKRAFNEFLKENPCLEGVAFGEYSFWPGDMNGKVFLVSRVHDSPISIDQGRRSFNF